MKIDLNLRKVKVLPTRDCAAGYDPTMRPPRGVVNVIWAAVWREIENNAHFHAIDNNVTNVLPVPLFFFSSSFSFLAFNWVGIYSACNIKHISNFIY